MGRTITLTSPHTEGDDVREAQELLASNRYGDFQPGAIDGVFGEETARACKRAKYWLGYAEDKLTSTFGPALKALLDGSASLSLTQRLRRRARLRAEKGKPLRAGAYEASLQHIGVKESPPESNRVPFSDWYGMVGPWCGMFVTYCYTEAGSKAAFKRGERWAYCPYMLAEAREGRNHLAVTKEPQTGDVVLYDWGMGIAKHVGLFEDWRDSRHGTFTAIEGNTAIGNDSNGGEVMRRERGTSQVIAFVHVGK